MVVMRKAQQAMGDMRVLVIEDDRETARYIAKGLGESGHTVDVTDNGRDGLVQATAGEYDVLIVDRMLPGLDGLAVVETLRKTGQETPVLFLSAKGRVDDRVAGLKAGADDYLALRLFGAVGPPGGDQPPAEDVG
jgi:two-component system OmpR family response regulator